MPTENPDGKPKVPGLEHGNDVDSTPEYQQKVDAQLRHEVAQLETAVDALEGDVAADLANLDIMAADPEFVHFAGQDMVHARAELERVAISARGVLRAFLDSVADVFYHQPVEDAKNYLASLEEKALAVPDNQKIINKIKDQLSLIHREQQKRLKKSGLERNNFDAGVLDYYHTLNSKQKEVGLIIFDDDTVALLETVANLRNWAAVKDEKKWESVDKSLDAVLQRKIALDASDGNLESVVHWFAKMQRATPDFAAQVARAVILNRNQGVENNKPPGSNYDTIRDNFIEIAGTVSEYLDSVIHATAEIPLLGAAFVAQKNNLYLHVLNDKENEIFQAFGDKITLWPTLDPDLKRKIIQSGRQKDIEKWLTVLLHPKKDLLLKVLDLNPFRSNQTALSDFSDSASVTEFLDSLPENSVQLLQSFPAGMYPRIRIKDLPLILSSEMNQVVISRAQKIDKVFSYLQQGITRPDVYTTLLFSDVALDQAVSEIDNLGGEQKAYEEALANWRESAQLVKKQEESLAQQNAVTLDYNLDFDERYKRVAALVEQFNEYRSGVLRSRPEKPVATAAQGIKNTADFLMHFKFKEIWSPADTDHFLELLKNVPSKLLRTVLEAGQLPPGAVQCHEVLRRDYNVPEDEIKNLIKRVLCESGDSGPFDIFICQTLLEANPGAYGNKSVSDRIWKNHRVHSAPETIAFMRAQDEGCLVTSVAESLKAGPGPVIAELQKIENIFPFFDIVGKYQPDFVVEYFDHLPEGLARNTALKGLNIADLQKQNRDILKITAANPTSSGLPWRAPLEKLRKVQDYAARAEHCPWVKELKPLVYGQLAKGNVDFASPADGELLLEYVKEFGAFNLSTIFDIFAEIKRGKTLADIWETEPGKKAKDFLGPRADKMRSPADLLNEVRLVRRTIQKETLEDKIPAGLHSELGAEIFNFLRGSTSWGRADGGIQTMATVWKESAAAHPEIARLPDGYKEVALAVAEVSVVAPSVDGAEGGQKEKEKSDILSNKNIQEQWKRSIEPVAEISNVESLSEWWVTKQAGVVRELQEQIDILMVKRGSLPEKAQISVEQSIARINTFLEKWRKIEIKTSDVNASELQNIIEELAQLANEFEKDKKLRAYADESVYPLSVVHMERIMPEGQMAYLTTMKASTKLPTEEGLIAYSRVMKEYVAEHYLHPEQEPDHIGHASFSKETLKKLVTIWQVGKKMETDNSLVRAGSRLEQLNNPDLVSTGSTRDVAMVPVRGLMRVFAGDIGDACYTSQHDRLAKGEFPGLTAGIMVSNRGTAQERMEGSVLFIETKTASGESALIVRANNPRMSLMEKVDPNDLIKKTLDYAIEVAKTRGIKRVVVPRDAASASCSNRQEVAKYYAEQFKGAPSVPLVESPDTTFNGYQIWNGTCVEIWHSEDVAPTTKPAPTLVT